MSELSHPFTTNVAKDFHCGLSVVDMIIVDFDRARFVMGRRKHKTQFQFPGGFYDVTKDDCLEDAAKREITEEVPGIEVAKPVYIGSLKVNDDRYKDDKDKIVSAVFVFPYVYGAIRAGDDIHEVQWFNIDTIRLESLISPHKAILDMFLKWWISGGKDSTNV
jgi:ADP-ribose pyrophosphatase YjhB (NUDIX family)